MRLCDERQAVNKLSSFNAEQIYRLFPLHQPSVDALPNKIIKLLIDNPYCASTSNKRGSTQTQFEIK